MHAPTGHPVKPLYCQGVFSDQWYQPCLRCCNAGLSGERHGGMLDQRHVYWLIVEKLDAPLLASNIDQRFGLGTAKAATGRQHTSLGIVDRLTRIDLRNNLSKLLCALEPGQRAVSPRPSHPSGRAAHHRQHQRPRL